MAESLTLQSFLKSSQTYDILTSLTPFMSLNPEETLNFFKAAGREDYLLDLNFWRNKAKYFSVYHEFESFLKFDHDNKSTNSLAYIFTKVYQWSVIDEDSLIYITLNRYMYLINLRKDKFYNQYLNEVKLWFTTDNSSNCISHEHYLFIANFIELASKTEVEELFFGLEEITQAFVALSDEDIVSLLVNNGNYDHIISHFNLPVPQEDGDENDIRSTRLAENINKGKLSEVIEEVKLIGEDFSYIEELIRTAALNLYSPEEILPLVNLAISWGIFDDIEDSSYHEQIRLKLGGVLGPIMPPDGQGGFRLITEASPNVSVDYFEWFNLRCNDLIKFNTLDNLINSVKCTPQFREMMVIKLGVKSTIFDRSVKDLLSSLLELSSHSVYQECVYLISSGWNLNLRDLYLEFKHVPREFRSVKSIESLLKLLNKVNPELAQPSVEEMLEIIKEKANKSYLMHIDDYNWFIKSGTELPRGAFCMSHLGNDYCNTVLPNEPKMEIWPRHEVDFIGPHHARYVPPSTNGEFYIPVEGETSQYMPNEGYMIYRPVREGEVDFRELPFPEIPVVTMPLI